MDVEGFRLFCLSLPETVESTPFDDDVLVYKVGGKMYAYASMSEFTSIGVKCDPARAVELRERYPDVGYASHMSKVHWIGLGTGGGLDDGFIRARILDSYELVIIGLPRARRDEVNAAREGLSE